MKNQTIWNGLLRPDMLLKNPKMRLFTVNGRKAKSYGNSFPMKICGIEIWHQLEIIDLEDEIMLVMYFVITFVRVIDIRSWNCNLEHKDPY